MPLTIESLHRRLLALRSSLCDQAWLSHVDAPVLAVFNELLAEAQRAVPSAQLLRSIERQKMRISARSMLSGHVQVMSGPASGSPKLLRTIGPDQSGDIKAGQWLVEQPTTIHTAKGVTRVVVLLANLLKNGAPAATPVK
jgi:hypothetical protein